MEREVFGCLCMYVCMYVNVRFLLRPEILLFADIKFLYIMGDSLDLLRQIASMFIGDKFRFIWRDCTYVQDTVAFGEGF